MVLVIVIILLLMIMMIMMIILIIMIILLIIVIIMIIIIIMIVIIIYAVIETVTCMISLWTGRIQTWAVEERLQKGSLARVPRTLLQMTRLYVYIYIYICMHTMCVYTYIYIYVIYTYIHYLSIYLSIYLSLSLSLHIYIYITYHQGNPHIGQSRMLAPVRPRMQAAGLQRLKLQICEPSATNRRILLCCFKRIHFAADTIHPFSSTHTHTPYILPRMPHILP